MGTTYTVKLADVDTSMNGSFIKQSIDELLIDINKIMSTYDPDSELSRLNQNRSFICSHISEQLNVVIEEALIISRLSDGAFDITIGSLVNLWGFGPDAFPILIPSDETIQQTLANVGYETIQLSASELCITNDKTDLYIDLSAIAKGYAVDRVAQLIESHGIDNFMVEIGGEIKARGVNASHIDWQIGIEQPTSSQPSVQNIISLKNMAMATSGDYRNYFEKDGIRYSHTINPKTGKPIRHNLVSVTVLHNSSMTADALATAFMVLGSDKGFNLAIKENLAVLFILKENDGFHERKTEMFNQLTIH